MNLQDDELVRRYHEASAQEGARPGAHVREAVRAHAQMVAAAHTAGPAPTPEAPAANQARWKISALATVALHVLGSLLLDWLLPRWWKLEWYHALALGGVCVAGPAQGGGWRVTVRLPFARNDQEVAALPDF